jgi:hypothetical protein
LKTLKHCQLVYGLNGMRPSESAVAAALCRRSPKPRGDAPIHGKGNLRLIKLISAE